MKLRVAAGARLLHAGDAALPCLIGRGGVCDAEVKREGDGCTPRGTWPLRALLFRGDRLPLPVTGLPWRRIGRDDGWSDDPADPAYNRPVRHPHRFSAERLWREDAAYDLIVVLGHNDAPPRPGLGSAIFLHCTAAAPATEGCVALAHRDLLALLPALGIGDALTIA